jgi:hypothetical protein
VGAKVRGPANPEAQTVIDMVGICRSTAIFVQQIQDLWKLANGIEKLVPSALLDVPYRQEVKANFWGCPLVGCTMRKIPGR